MERDGDLKCKLDDTTVKRLVDLAEKTTFQILPKLRQRLQSDLNLKESLAEELGELLGQRLWFVAFQFFVQIEVIRRNPDRQGTDRDFLREGQLIEENSPLTQRVYGVFLRQIEEYRKKHKEDISQVILKAKGGNARAIRSLLEWDKSWISFDLIHGEIARRGYRYRDEDRGFLELVGDAIKKKPTVRDNAEECALLSLIELYANRYDLSGKNNKHLKMLYSWLSEDLGFDSGIEEEANLRADFKYFVRYLKRHHIL